MQFTEYFVTLLQGYGVDTVFGIVGIPIVELADAMIDAGIKFIACRNEQSASYAASAYGYLTGKPGVLLVVGGPGLVHALAGIYNSMCNMWPLLVLAGSSEMQHRGGFQELDQVSLLSPYVKYAARLNTHNINDVTYDAMRLATATSAGTTYIDIPGNLLNRNIEGNPEAFDIATTKSRPDPVALAEVCALIRKHGSHNVLLVVGKGSVHASDEIRDFVNLFAIPFLPTPMGKGIIPDSHPLNVSSARSRALKEAQLVLILGARLNWILHFGSSPKWNPNAIFIQVDSDATALGHNNPRNQRLSLQGDIGLTVKELSTELEALSWRCSGLSETLQSTISANTKKLQMLESHPVLKLNYNVVYATLRPFINDQATIIIAEGANTMDKARISFPTDYPRRRLDAGTNATMGVGLGYALAAKVSKPHKTVLLIQGDSAFGFSAMELETATRQHLALIVIVMNNGGIYHGKDPNLSTRLPAPSTALTTACRYDLVGMGLGTHSYMINSLPELEKAFKNALQDSHRGQSSVINVVLEPGDQKKLSFGWQTRL
ncbi:related to Putative 2-hydroxyacyl-CoA lyase [Zygosaccharomyces bailii]|nr:related to Putative 2-hydroxyacyl-CoA lyase [Zygosaccharomyces bailii]